MASENISSIFIQKNCTAKTIIFMKTKVWIYCWNNNGIHRTLIGNWWCCGHKCRHNGMYMYVFWFHSKILQMSTQYSCLFFVGSEKIEKLEKLKIPTINVSKNCRIVMRSPQWCLERVHKWQTENGDIWKLYTFCWKYIYTYMCIYTYLYIKFN